MTIVAQSLPRPRAGRTLAFKPKNRLGCMTCRIRKVKCDEEKPECRRCVSTGRTCDGYESVFRSYNYGHNMTVPSQADTVSVQRLSFRQLRTITFTTSEIMEVSRGLSTKPPAEGGIGFEAEALCILQSSIRSSPVYQALACMRMFRKLLMEHGDISNLKNDDLSGYRRSVTEYNIVVAKVIKQLSRNDSRTVEVALNCCQLFITIDIMLQQYASSIRHFAYGLQIMRACRTRPQLDSAGEKIVSPIQQGIATVDIFVIKLFTAPCPYIEHLMRELRLEERKKMHAADNSSPNRIDFMTYRQTLILVAAETVSLLNRVSSMTSVHEALGLIEEKKRLLIKLEGLDRYSKGGVVGEDESPLWKLMSHFQLLYSSVLRVVLQSVLLSAPVDSPLDLDLTHMISVAESLEGAANNYLIQSQA